MVVITRWKKKENSEEILVVDDKKVMEVIAIKENENVESKLPRVMYNYISLWNLHRKSDKGFYLKQSKRVLSLNHNFTLHM
jgi:hypothetical protein